MNRALNNLTPGGVPACFRKRTSGYIGQAASILQRAMEEIEDAGLVDPEDGPTIDTVCAVYDVGNATNAVTTAWEQLASSCSALSVMQRAFDDERIG